MLYRINKTQPLMESSSCFHSIATLVLRLLTYIYNEEMDDTSVPLGLILNLLLDVENLLPAVLHNIMSVLNSKEFTFTSLQYFWSYTQQMVVPFWLSYWRSQSLLIYFTSTGEFFHLSLVAAMYVSDKNPLQSWNEHDLQISMYAI